MTYVVHVDRDPRDYLRRLDTRTRQRVLVRLDELAADPRFHGKPMAGTGQRWTSRVGSFRIIYTIDDENRVVYVSRIGPRGQIYRDR